MSQRSITQPKFSLRLKLSIGLILIIGVIFAGINTFNILSHRKALREEASTNIETLTRLIVGAITGELANNPLDSARMRYFVNSFLTAALTLNANNKDLAFALVVTADNKLITGRARPQLVQLPGNRYLTAEADVLSEVARLNGKLGEDMRIKSFTFKGGNREDLGKLLVGMSMIRLEKEVRQALYINISVFLAALFVLIAYAGVTLNRMVVRPITEIMGAMRAVHEGDLSHEVAPRSRDEIGVLASTYNFMVTGLREKAMLKDAFSRYVSAQVLEKIEMGNLTLTGEARNATVLFSDIRSFTNLSERLSPAEIVAMLNEYFNVMVEIIFKYNGFLNKFIGDALMAVYNVPIDQGQPELRAVKTALEMIEALNKLNDDRKQRGQYEIKIGIGINTGPVVAGNIGHLRRLEYTVIGDTVNLAQRIESQTKVTGSAILISDSTYRAVAEHIDAQELPPVKVKGKQEPVVLWAVLGLKGQTPAPEVLELAEPTSSTNA